MIVADLTAVYPLVTTPWWIWALVIGAMLAVLGVSVFISARSGSSENPPAQPPEPPAPQSAPEPEPEVHVAPQTAEFDTEHMEVQLPDGEIHVPPIPIETPEPDLLPDNQPLPAIEAMGRERDDLKLVRGVSPGAAAVLRQAGIQTFMQLAATSVDDLEKILRAAGMRNLNPRSWPEQAQLAASGDWQGLEQLQKQLSAQK